MDTSNSDFKTETEQGSVTGSTGSDLNVKENTDQNASTGSTSVQDSNEGNANNYEQPSASPAPETYSVNQVTPEPESTPMVTDSGNYGVDWSITDDGALHIEPGILKNMSTGEKEDDVDLISNPWTYQQRDKVTSITFDGKVIAGSDVSGFLSRFNNLTSITNLDMLDTSNSTNMRGLFADDRNLKSIDLSNINTLKASNMYEMFSQDHSLPAIVLGKQFNGDSLTDATGMFLV